MKIAVNTRLLLKDKLEGIGWAKIGADGSLTGYGGGIMRKKALLELEGNDMSQFSIPTKGTAL